MAVEEMKEGGDSLMNTTKANELIRQANKIDGLKVEETSEKDAKFEFVVSQDKQGKGNVVLTVPKRLMDIIALIASAPSSGTHVLGVQDGTVQWLPTTQC